MPKLSERLSFLLPARFRPARRVVPVVRLSGAIGAVMPFRPGLSLQTCGPALERAFAVPDARAVAIIVNSPGGSAVQSHLIFQRIRALSEEKGRPVLVFVEDAAASGGYMIACAGDEIFADPASIVGSIGVVSAGFGFTDFIRRIGVERRVHTAGESKAMLDPFRPEDPADVGRLKGLQARIHDLFIALVQGRRGGRLRPAEGDGLFSGAVWTGAEALELGLIDGLGDVRTVLKERFGPKVELKPIPLGRPGLMSRWFAREPVSGTSLVDPAALAHLVEERALWARLGL